MISGIAFVHTNFLCLEKHLYDPSVATIACRVKWGVWEQRTSWAAYLPEALHYPDFMFLVRLFDSNPLIACDPSSTVTPHLLGTVSLYIGLDYIKHQKKKSTAASSIVILPLSNLDLPIALLESTDMHKSAW